MQKLQMTKLATVIAVVGFMGTVEAEESVFKHLDRDADGYISAEEAGVHQGLTMGYIAADKNEDGKIDAAEFAVFESQNTSMQPVQDK
jgi:Ca2+-binding EF-hand superfamily protein